MRSKRRMLAGALAAFTLVFGAVFVGRAAAGPASGAAAAATVSFTDPAGDANGAPDITAASVADDAASGMFQVSLTAPGLGSIDRAADPMVFVWLNTDKNDLTGSITGAEYVLVAWRDPEGLWYDIARWNGSSWEMVPESSTTSASLSGDTQIWRFNKADLGGTLAGFTFYAESRTYDANDNIVASDRAPNNGTFTYDVAVKPVIGAPTMAPANAVAGKKVVVTFPVTRADNAQPLTIGTMICDPSVKGKVIAHAESFVNGQAKLAFTIPKSAKGKVLSVKVTIQVGDLSTTRVATFRVK